MRSIFYTCSAFALLFIGVLTWVWKPLGLLFIPALLLIGVGLHNIFQKKKAVLRNFPILGLFRYFFEMIRPEIQQYFVESETDGAPLPRELRSVVYQRAKKQNDTLPFGTMRDVYAAGYEWIGHSLDAQKVDPESLRVKVGSSQCKKPYSASVFNISAMSYGALSKNAILALNGGAKLGGFYHNTGEGGLSPHHLAPGGDLVWQIGTGYFGCRTLDGKFDPELFKAKATIDSVKMIEIKLSQGAKPSHGGILPAAKVTPEIMEIRRVPAGVDVLSPPLHSAFSGPAGLIGFIAKLRELSGGKPIGFKLCIGIGSEFEAICKAMIDLKTVPDFITVDGGEGGTGAAPMEFSDNVGAPLEEGLVLVRDTLVKYGLKKEIKIIAAGKIVSGFTMFSRMALGADMCNTARGMLLALGCIQARRCNTNHCPTGVATSDPKLTYGLDPDDKKVRVYNYHKNTLHAFAELLGAAGLTQVSDIKRTHVFRRISTSEVRTYEALYPSVGVHVKQVSHDSLVSIAS